MVFVACAMSAPPATFGGGQGIAFAQSNPKTVRSKLEIKNWRQQAVKHLRVGRTPQTSAPLRPDLLYGAVGWRCPRLNNYWCLKMRSSGWPGAVGQDGDGHAAFSTARFGAAAAVRLLRTYYLVRNLRTVHDIVCRYAPDADCIGSKAGKDDRGRCQLGANQCTSYAFRIAAELGTCTVCDAQLFDSRQRATANLQTMLRHLSHREISHFSRGIRIYPTDQLIKDGIATERRLP